MLKVVVKLALSALIANAAWRLGSAYVQFYKFKDAVTETAQFGGGQSSSDLTRRMLILASEYDLPLAEGDLTVRRDDRHHTTVDGSYSTPIDFAPGFRRRWAFQLHVDVLTLQAPPADPPR
jgi:hypothetical protein